MLIATNNDRVSIQNRCVADFAAVKDRSFLARWFRAYIGGEAIETHHFNGFPRVCITDMESVGMCWSGIWCYPRWIGELVAPYTIRINAKKLTLPSGTTVWLDGIAYSITGETRHSDLIGVEHPVLQ